MTVPKHKVLESETFSWLVQNLNHTCIKKKKEESS